MGWSEIEIEVFDAAEFISLDPGMEVVELRQGLVSQGFFDSKRLCLG